MEMQFLSRRTTRRELLSHLASIFISADGFFNFFGTVFLGSCIFAQSYFGLFSHVQCTHAPRPIAFALLSHSFVSWKRERTSCVRRLAASFAPLCCLGKEKIRRGSWYPHFSGLETVASFKK